MMDMGFRPDLERISRARPSGARRCCSRPRSPAPPATWRGHTRTSAPPRPPADREKTAQVEHRFVQVLHEAKLDALVDQLEGDRGLALVFVRTKRGADRLVKRLGTRGVKALALHGNKTQNQRERALAAFERWDVDTLVATDVAARGIDVADITHVVNFDAPEDQDGYVHRTGRTGRAGRDGLAITFVMGDQARDIGAIAHKLGLQGDFERAGFAPHASPRPQHRRRARLRPRRPQRRPLAGQPPVGGPRRSRSEPRTSTAAGWEVGPRRPGSVEGAPRRQNPPVSWPAWTPPPSRPTPTQPPLTFAALTANVRPARRSRVTGGRP